MKNLDNMTIEEMTINTIRTLSMDAVQKANSGHPGTPMALAPLAYLLYKNVLQHNPKNPEWFNRDRFILSAGHASMLLYSILHLSGYDVSLDDLKKFRQLGSTTPGHPEFAETPGVETTTGPLGQGISNSVGMAIAEAHLAATYNRDDFNIIDHYTYALCSDGDFMEGVSHEAASIAGHFKLGKLIWFYDDNHISIEGQTELTYSDNVLKRVEAYHWHVIDLGEKADDLDAIQKAVDEARAETERPSLIIVRSHIGYGAPNLQDTNTAHGAPLGEDEIKATKKFYGWPEDEHFLVPDGVKDHMSDIIKKGKKSEDKWQNMFASYKEKYPQLAEQLESSIAGRLPKDWDSDLPTYSPDKGAQATRSIGGEVLNAISAKVPYVIGGAADLNPSTKTFLKNSGYFAADAYQNKNIPWGVREFIMAGASSGLALHGGLRPFASTFYVFTDYARPAIRMAALMKLPVIYVMTHDSIAVGEDGPTHQPVEHLTSFRAMPNLTAIRPADANEVTEAWRVAMQHTDGPCMLVMTRQKLPIFDRSKVASAKGVAQGAYILSKEKGDQADIILIGSGSEVHLLLEAKEELAKDGIDARVVSMPSWELFRKQDKTYKESVLDPKVKKRLAVEAATAQGWCEWVGDKGDVIGMHTFGASGPYKEVLPHFGFSVGNVVKKVRTLLK